MAENYNNDVNELSENRALVRSDGVSGDHPSSPQTATNDLRQQVQQYGQQASEAINRAKDYAGQYLGQAGDKFKDLQNKDFNQITEDAKDYARRKPAQAIAISAAAGLILGFILRSGRR